MVCGLGASVGECFCEVAEEVAYCLCCGVVGCWHEMLLRAWRGGAGLFYFILLVRRGCRVGCK